MICLRQSHRITIIITTTNIIRTTFSNSSISNIQRPLTFYFEDPLVSSKAINVELKLKVSAAFV